MMTSMSFFFFFFQAEDGIRDYKVTGVQTCALPILPILCVTTCILVAQSNLSTLTKFMICAGLSIVSTFSSANGVVCWVVILPMRSEERRVGKECSCGSSGCL